MASGGTCPSSTDRGPRCTRACAAGPRTAPAARTPQTPAPDWDPIVLTNPALTGLSPHQLDDLTQNLALALALALDSQRGRPPQLPFPDQVLATVLHLRVNLAAEPPCSTAAGPPCTAPC
jgi:hypothetical protein